MKPIVIIGTGLAGYGLAKELRRLAWQGPLTLITADDGRSYSKPMLSSALAKGKDAITLANADAEKMAVDLDAEIRTHSRVTEIDTDGHRIVVNGESIGYGSLVLASGASPIRLPFKGDGAEEVLSVNNLTDYGLFREKLDRIERVAVIGPGLIGSEFANDMLQVGKKVTLIGPDPWPISTLIPEAAGRAVQMALADAGADWRLGTFNGAIERKSGGFYTALKDGGEVEADLFLSAVGVRPDLTLGQAAGLEVNKGIVADRFLRTSARDVYVLGDVAEVEGRNLPYVAPLLVGAKALARTLAGEETPVVYPHMPVVIKTTLHPIATLPPGPGEEGTWRFDDPGADGGVTGRFYDSSGALAGFVLTGEAAGRRQALVKEMEEAARAA